MVVLTSSRAPRILISVLSTLAEFGHPRVSSAGKSMPREGSPTPPPIPASARRGSGDDPKEEGKTGSGLVADKAVTEALTEFREAIGREGQPGKAAEARWDAALRTLTASQLQNVCHDVKIPAPEWIGQETSVLIGILLQHERLQRPRVKTAEEIGQETSAALLAELRSIRQEAAAERAANQEERVAFKEQLEGLQREVSGAKAEATLARQEAKDAKSAKASSTDLVEEEAKDDRSFVPHYKSEDLREDGSLALNPHQTPPRPLGCSPKPHLLPGLDETPLGRELLKHGSKEASSF